MLKNTKVVGVAAAITLLTGVAFAPSASAVNGSVPSLSVSDTSVNAGERFDFTVSNVLTGCSVTTKVGSITKTSTATRDRSYDRKGVGQVDTFIQAPSIAGDYTLSSMVSNSCASDAGYKRAADMSVDVTVGEELYGNLDWSNIGGFNARIYGDIEDGDGDNVDLGRVKVLFSVRGKVVASAYTDSDGYVSATVAARDLNKRGNTKVTISLEKNRFYWVDDYEVVDR